MHSNFTILSFETSLRTIISDAVSRTLIYSRNATHCLLLNLAWLYNFWFLINKKEFKTMRYNQDLQINSNEQHVIQFSNF